MAYNYKILGQVEPADTNDANLYTVPAATTAIVSNIAVVNTTASDATYRIYVREAGAGASTANALAYDVTATAKTTTAISMGVTLSATDVITVSSSTGSTLTFHAFGTEVA